jgi:hypothetical protein
MGRRRSGTVNPTMVIPPENSPAAPDPAMALPAMRTLEFGATAHTTEPTADD